MVRALEPDGLVALQGPVALAMLPTPGGRARQPIARALALPRGPAQSVTEKGLYVAYTPAPDDSMKPRAVSG